MAPLPARSRVGSRLAVQTRKYELRRVQRGWSVVWLATDPCGAAEANAPAVRRGQAFALWSPCPRSQEMRNRAPHLASHGRVVDSTAGLRDVCVHCPL
jgi:hypothetical protein